MEVWHLLVHVLTFLLVHQTCCLSLLNNNNSTEYPWCRQLLHLKNQFFPYGTRDPFCSVVTWNQSLDCCGWDGVSCDASRRQVVGLDLSSCGLTSIPSNTSTLFTLTHFQKLSLAQNYFYDSQIPPELGRLNHLTHLDLSDSAFAGKIPKELYHLSNMESLDLTWNLGLIGDIKMLLGNMSKIRKVFLSAVQLDSELPANMSSFLTHLDLEATGVESEQQRPLHRGTRPHVDERLRHIARLHWFHDQIEILEFPGLQVLGAHSCFHRQHDTAPTDLHGGK